MRPIEVLRCFEEVVERDARCDRAREHMTENLGAEVDQRKKRHDPRSGDSIGLGIGTDLLARLQEIVVPALRESDGVDQVPLRLGFGGENQVLALGREEQAAAVDLLELDRELDVDPSTALCELGPSLD